MNVLLLGPTHKYNRSARAVLELSGDTPTHMDNVPANLADFDWLVSFGCRHILKRDILVAFPNRAVNIHIGFLPWNRGSDPNLWSFVDKTPSGVTIHQIDEGVDTGPILAQRAVSHRSDDTLASSYMRLMDAAVNLFAETWPAIRAERLTPRPQVGVGTLHRVRDRIELPLGWDTPVIKL